MGMILQSEEGVGGSTNCPRLALALVSHSSGIRTVTVRRGRPAILAWTRPKIAVAGDKTAAVLPRWSGEMALSK